MRAELLIRARCAEVFSIYHDPHYWSMHLQSIRQAYFDRSLAPGAKGAIDIAGIGRWTTRVTLLYDDSEMVIQLRRLCFSLRFRLRVQRVEPELQRVSHTLSSNLLFLPLFMLYRRSIHEWLSVSLYMVQAHAQKIRHDAIEKSRTQPTKRPKRAKRSKRTTSTTRKRAATQA